MKDTKKIHREFRIKIDIRANGDVWYRAQYTDRGDWYNIRIYTTPNECESNSGDCYATMIKQYAMDNLIKHYKAYLASQTVDIRYEPIYLESEAV